MYSSYRCSKIASYFEMDIYIVILYWDKKINDLHIHIQILFVVLDTIYILKIKAEYRIDY